MTVQAIWGNKREEVFLRREFTLDHVTSAVLRIYVDTGYELFINERLVTVVDEWNNTRDLNVRPFLRCGTNLIALHGLNHAGHRGCSLELCCNGQVVIVSDSSWSAASYEEWDWMRLDFDHSQWQKATVLPLQYAGTPQWRGHAGDCPEAIIPVLKCSPFFAGEIPKAIESPFYSLQQPEYTISDNSVQQICAIVGDQYLASREQPKAIIDAKNFPPLPGTVTAADRHFHLSSSTQGQYFFVDFGEETVGYFRLRVKSSQPVSFRLRYGETLAECQVEIAKSKLLRRMLSEDIYLEAGAQEWESRQRVGFRFVRVEFYNCPADVEVTGISMRSSLYPVDYCGYFSCSDANINKIWQAGRKTLHLCMQEYYLDGVKRDRFLWVGDTRAEALYNYYLFGDTALFRFCWEEIASVQYVDGSIPSAMGMGSSIIWDYVAWYVIAFHDYLQFTGDSEFVLKLQDSIYAATDWLVSKTNSSGLIDVPENPYPTWMVTLHKGKEIDSFLNWLYLRVLDTAVEVAELSENARAMAKYQVLLQKVKPAVSKLLTAAPIAQEQAHWHNATGFYEVLELMFRAGETSQALQLLREKWTAMLASGADTLYEGFYVSQDEYPVVTDANSKPAFVSFCHGWTAGICSLLPGEIAGIKPLTPGFNRFQVAPRPVDLERIDAVVPTPRGEIIFSWRENELLLRVPENTVCELDIINPVSIQKILDSGIHQIKLL